MKIALIQQSASDNKTTNIERGLTATKEAALNGANIICFAELSFTKFFPQYLSNNNNVHLAETIPGSTTNLFSKLAKEFGVVIILNLFEKNNQITYDSSPILNIDENILGTTRMVHIADYTCFHEKGYYFPGNNGVEIYDTIFGKIGIAICYNRHYPEYMRALALKGAE